MSDLYNGVDLPTLAQRVEGLSQLAATNVRVAKTSASALSAGIVARLVDGTLAAMADVGMAAQALSPLGITESAVSAAGQPIGLTLYGEIENVGWSWTPQRALFLGPSSQLTQTRQTSWPYLRIVAYAISPTRIFVNPQLPLFQL